MRQCSWILTGLVGLALIGCQSGGTTAGPTAEGKRLTLAVIPKGSTHIFWKSVQAGAEDAGRELGIEIIWKGPMKEDDRDDQIKVVEDFIARGVDGIVLAPLDDTALRLPVMEAQNRGIPVLIIDSALRDVETVSFVATDNYAAGQSAGQRLRELLPEGGRIVLLRYQEGSASTREREEGFLAVVRQHPDLVIVSDNQYAGPTTETAQAAAENLLNRFSGGLDGVFCPNESSTFGMLRALQGAGLAGQIRFIGFDSSPTLVQALEAGEIDALVVQDPYRMGYDGVRMLHDHLRGNTVERKVDCASLLVDRGNIADPSVRPLVLPD